MSKLVVIDGNSILNRAFYGIMGNKMLMTADGTYTNAIYGFLSILFKITEDIKPEYLAVAFDLKAPTYRHKLYDGYKANRKGMPKELADQMPILKEILNAMNIEIIEKEGYEADDILGTLAKKASLEGIDTILLTGDRDSFQLAQDNVTIRIPRTKMGKTEEEDFDRNKVLEVYGVEPQKLIEVKGLAGDTSDNIPGVAGVGEKTAINLVKEYGSIEELYKKLEENTDNVKGKLREKLIENKEMAFLSKTLGTIDVNAPIEIELEEIKVKEWNKERVTELFKRLRFNRFLERFSLEAKKEAVVENIEIEKIEDQDKIKKIKEIIEQNKKIYYHLSTQEINEDEIINKKITAISIYDEIEKKVYYIKDVQAFKEIFESEEIEKYSAKLKIQYILLKQIGIEPKNLTFDVEIAGYILNATAGKYSVEELAQEYLDMDIEAYLSMRGKKSEEQINLFEEEKQVDSSHEGIYAYAIFCLKQKLEENLKKTKQLELFQTIEMPLVTVLADMQYTGIYVNKEELIEFGKKLQEDIKTLVKDIYNLAGTEFNINSPKQLGEVLFEKLELPVIKKTKSGYSTDVDVLEKLKNEHPIIEKILEYRALNKLNSTYVEGLIPYINKKTGRIHSYFHQTVTATGRISSTEPNLQNIPTRMELGKSLRKVFTPKENYIFVDADYSQIELRVLAHISKDENMINAFKHDEDIHTQAASRVFNVPINEVTKELRGQAKAVNFGIVYGISDFGLGEQLGVSRKVAKEYIDEYLNKYSGIKEFMENITKTAEEKGYVETLFKRKREIPELKSNNYMVRQFGNRVAMNTPIQGTAADIMKKAMIEVYEEIKKENLKSRIILQVHDELLIETEKGEKEKINDILKKHMENVIKLEVPLKIEISEGENWYEAK